MRYIATITCSGLLQVLHAQPAIPPGNSSYEPGEFFRVHIGPYLVPPPDGMAGATWDYGMFQAADALTEVYVDPGLQPLFPTATAAGTGLDEALRYYRADPEAYVELGFIDNIFTMVCQDPMVLFPYPLTFGDEVTDLFACEGLAPGEPATRTGSITHVGASYGTLQLPYGEFDNVLMIRVQQDHVTTVQGFDYTFAALMHWFIKPGIRHPLLVLADTETNPGAIVQYSLMVDEAATGVAGAMASPIGVELWPNPAQGEVVMTIGATGRPMTLELLDATGRKLRRTDLGTLPLGIHQHTFDLQGLAVGIHLLRVVDDRGQHGTARLVVR